ncbi:Restriction modification system DNA specificity domain protein [Edwardsiella anguillarum]|uniref:restriction endonuclease subunit S n=1 Tax=Edwardsiella TaxID=635 RepID=UPI00045D2810|nr:restriction endonuclease subunit S [Edwardsiella anguillarum]BET84474.1 Restriction modification system DNA specificity domain protein [Edwardsiella anguillarum]BET87840.1 Restriction modification system DNA specificity domain protein [Edwardsiella anguillarum]GAJ68623.1 restriction modification system DNA specificity domain protein [Edwardsiella piscicida]
MGSKWPLIKLGDFVQIVTGHPFKSKDYSEVDGVKLLRGDNIAQGTLNWQNVKMLPDDKIGSKERNYYLRTGDVILAMDRPWIEAGLKTAQINENDLPCLLVQRVACLRCEDSSDQDFIRYIISSYSFVQYVKLIQTGTAVPHISGKQIKNFEFRLPPKNVRKVIGEVIKRLDDKAHINRQINQTLEQMAQALFKSWFVDFDPVIDNALDAGFFEQNSDLPEALLRRAEQRKVVCEHPDFTPLPAETRQLFPAAFEACDEPSLGLGGWVPKGWNITSSGKQIDVRDGTHDSPKKSEFGFPLVTSKNLTSGRLDLANAYLISEMDYNEVNKRSNVEQGDILLTMIGTLGIPCLVSTKNVCFAIKNVGLFKTSKTPQIKMYFFELLKSKGMQEYLESRSAGTTQRYLSLKVLRNISFILPNIEVLSKFNNFIDLNEHKSQQNDEQNAELTNIRDTLLPKLISGELRLSDDGTLADGDTDC